MSRLNPIAPERMSVDQKKLFEAITGGARGAHSDPSEFLNDEGALRGPFNALLRAPELGDLVQRVGEGVRFQTSLPGSLRELAIITCARHWQSNYEWYAHARLARREGISDETIAGILDGTAPTQTDERLIYSFVRQLNETGRVDNENYDAVLKMLGETGVTELTILSGYYALVAQLLNTFRVPVPAGEQQAFPD